MKKVRLTLVFAVLVLFSAIIITYESGRKMKGSTMPTIPDASATYTNPLHLEQEWPDYGIGDPFVMRYNGTYYLYCSTKDGRAGIKAWSSKDLVHWSYAGLVTEDPITTGAYAPEVVYWNGNFYMYTSPAGKGHYVLQSESPTGPFQVKTDNLGNSIDGDVFIDDDGKWYFTNAGPNGIIGHEMPDPYTIGDGKVLSASLGGWTEGSMIIKRGGLYYLTYTGNHVFSKGYRVNYAVSRNGPLGDYTVPDNNPILISTIEGFNGLGHSSTVLGPDMDSYYIVYHNLVGRSQEGPPVRSLNIDRLVFNGGKMAVLGPTHSPQQAPSLPVFAYRPVETAENAAWTISTDSDGKIVQTSKLESGERYTAEFNVQSVMSGMEFLASYRGADDYLSVKMDPASNKLSVAERKPKGERILGTADLPEGMDYAKLHSVRVEAAASGLAVYFDHMQKIEVGGYNAGAGKIGYRYGAGKAKLQYTAFSNAAGGSSDFAVPKPVPGSIEAVHYMPGGGSGYHIKHPEGKPNDYRPQDGVSIDQADDGSRYVTLRGAGDWLEYSVHAADNGRFGIAMMLQKPADGMKLEISVDGKRSFVYAAKQPLPEAETGSWIHIPLGSLDLTAGNHKLRVKLDQGNVTFRSLSLYPMAAHPQNDSDLFKHLSPEGIFGSWFPGGQGYAVQKSGQDAMLFAGQDDWTDYRVDVDIQGTGAESVSDGAVLLRATNESYFREQVADSFMGYEAVFRNGRLVLRKINYDVTEDVAGVNYDLPPERKIHLTAEVRGGFIQLLVGGKTILSWQDPNPYFHGKVGIRTSDPSWQFANLSVTFPK